MSVSRYKKILDNSIHAAISAIEIYNKPDFKYREENFCILMGNAWELLLKAKYIKENNNKINCLYVKENIPTSDGKKGKRLRFKTNRSGNKITIGLFEVINKLELTKAILLNRACKANIEILIEIRDNAIHFYNKDPLLCQKVLEVGTASLKSFLQLIHEWFKYDLSQYNFYLMPITFFHEFEFTSTTTSSRDKKIENLLKYITYKENENPSNESSTHNISLRLETKFVKSTNMDALSVKLTDDKNAFKLRVQEEDLFNTKYTIDYQRLVQKCKLRYVDFKQNKKFHDIRQKIKDGLNSKRYLKTRYLDPLKKNGTKKTFFSREIYIELDKNYKRRDKK